MIYNKCMQPQTTLTQSAFCMHYPKVMILCPFDQLILKGTLLVQIVCMLDTRNYLQ